MDNKHYTTNDIEKLISEEKYIEASNSYIGLISYLKDFKSPLLAETYYEYALFLFNLQEYELSLLMFQSSYNLGFEKEKTIDFIYCSFVSPNQDEFREAYETNVIEYQKNILYNYIPSFDDLPIDFIPITDNKYLIFNNEIKKFEGTIDFSETGILSYKQVEFIDEFTDLILADDWNISKIHDYLISGSDRLIYYITTQPLQTLSFLKLPNIMAQYCQNLYFVDSIEHLQLYFHENTSVYLPHQYFVSDSTIASTISQLIKNEHEYRLTPEGRNTDNIILTLAIPSLNRGHRALKNVQHLMNLLYDAEIEIAVSNSCSTENTEGYDEIEEISDSRINYYKFTDINELRINFCQAVHIANGKYVCLISDEDIINLPAIPHYLSILRKNSNLSFIKGKTALYYKDNTGRIYAKGRDAFLQSFLTTNYISGLIYRKDLFYSLNVYSWIKDQVLNNAAVYSYAHSCWSALYTLHGDYLEEDTLLCIEGISENDALLTDISKDSKPITVMSYGTVEERLNQHFGFIDILNQLSIYLDRGTYIEGFTLICRKTCFLIHLIKKQYMSKGDDWNSICTEVYNSLINGISKLNIDFSEDEQSYLMDCIYSCYLYMSK